MIVSVFGVGSMVYDGISCDCFSIWCGQYGI